MFIFPHIAVGIHLEYHDVDLMYLKGMISEMKDKYAGSVDVDINSLLKYPQKVPYGVESLHLEDRTKKLWLRTNQDMKRVDMFLEKCHRSFIETDAGNNNAIHAICMQLHMPKNFNANMLRHQFAEYLVQCADFFEPKMENYLKNNNLTFSAYVHAVYKGDIWSDEFILGGIGRMFNIRISMISPFFNEIWNIYHDGKEEADVILIGNGIQFGTSHHAITHVTATKGTGNIWKCVGSDQEFPEVELYSGFVEGQKIALDCNTVNQNRAVFEKTKDVLKDINRLCRDIKEICLRRDKILNKLEDLDMELGDFTRLTSYFFEEEVAHSATSSAMPVLKRKVQIFPSHARGIPKVRVKDPRKTDIGQQLLREAMEEIDQEYAEKNPETAQELQNLHGVIDIDQYLPKQDETRQDHGGVIPHQKKRNCGDTIPEKTRCDRSGERGWRCRVKVPGSRAPLLTPDLPSLGKYASMISTPEKNSPPKTRKYKSSVPREETIEREEGEIIDEEEEDNQLQEVHELINNNVEVENNNGKQKQDNQPTNIHEQVHDQLENVTDFNNDNITLISDDDYSVGKDITIPDELIIISEDVVTKTLGDIAAIHNVSNEAPTPINLS
ncbi:MAG: hypothetical protein MJE68_30535, partial [Proteobacteria bacterium]|nr:hypothetical protein [Pseudomonadota bacterium]